MRAGAVCSRPGRRAAGLRARPLEQTVADTLAWELSRRPRAERRAGLPENDERELLARVRA